MADDLDPTPEDERIDPPDMDDDETVTDPVGETDEQDDDGGEDDEPAAAEAGGEEPPARQPSRGDRQFGDLRRQARERAEENARLTRELAEMRNQMAELRRPVGETEQQRRERFALMSPEERAEEIVNTSLRAHDARTQQLQAQLLDQADRSSFSARCAANPLLNKLSAEVERRHAELTANGQVVNREVVAKFLIGEKVLAQQGKAKPGAQQRRQQQTTRPARPQGDAGGARRQRAAAGSAEDFESRFGDVQI